MSRDGSDSPIHDVHGRLESHLAPEAPAGGVHGVGVQLHAVDSTSPEPIHGGTDQRLARSPVSPARLDEHVVDVSVPSVLEDLRSLENRREEEADRDAVDFGREAEAVLASDMLAREALPLSPPSRSEAILRAADTSGSSRTPSSRPRIWRAGIRGSGDPNPVPLSG